MTRNDVDDEARVHKLDTTPPPEGEDDAYNAPTKVGEVNNQAWAALLAQAAEEDPPASSMAKPVASGVKSTKPPESKVPADGSNGMPLLYDEEEESDEDSDEAATLLHPHARLARLGRGLDGASGETPRSAPHARSAPPAPRSAPPAPRSAPRSSGEAPRSAPPRSSKDAATLSPPAIPAPIVPHAPAPPSRPVGPPRPGPSSSAQRNAAPPAPRSGPSLPASSPPTPHAPPAVASAPPAPRSGPSLATSSPPSGVPAVASAPPPANAPSARPDEPARASVRPPTNGIVHTPPLATIPPPPSQQPPSLAELSSRGEPISLAPGGLLNPVPHPSTFAPAAPKKDYLLLLIGVAAAVGFLTLAVGILLALGRL